MRLLVLTALAAALFVGYLLAQETRELASDVGSLSTDHAVASGAPRLLNGASVPVRSGIAGFQVACDSETGCTGTVTITLDHDQGGNGTAYELAAKGNHWLGIPLPPDTHATKGTLTMRATTGATTTADFVLNRL
jgi:hypothetical protein